MAKDLAYLNGVIAVKETYLLGSKLLKFCEASADEVFRSLSECGFGRNAARSAFEYESLLAADERDLDEFVQEYAPTSAEKAYFLAPRDFHNAKAVIKAKYSGGDADKMVAPQGLIALEEIIRCVEENNFNGLPDCLKKACQDAVALLSDESKTAVGADIGVIFERAKYKYLTDACKRNKLLKSFAVQRADMTDIISAFRAKTPEYALDNAIMAGKVTREQLLEISNGDGDKAISAFENSPYKEFVKVCVEEKQSGRPFASAERIRDSVETESLVGRRFELKAKEPFLYYVLRRMAENSNLRIIFVCLLAGVEENAIKARLRAV